MAVLVLELLLVVALTDDEPLSTRDESSTLVSDTPVPGRLGPDEALTLACWRIRTPPLPSADARRQVAVTRSRKLLSDPPLG